ncbi:MAG: acetyl esterase/lipase [Verrucomicrobiales bacterium]
MAKSYWVKNIHSPSLTAYLPAKDKATGDAVMICPGSGHVELVFGIEGQQPAKILQERGIAAFVLKYRLQSEPAHPTGLMGMAAKMRTAPCAWSVACRIRSG